MNTFYKLEERGFMYEFSSEDISLCNAAENL